MILQSFTKFSLLTWLVAHSVECAAAGHSIRISMESTVYAMFDPLKVSVTFQNDGKADWSVYKPDESPFTLLECLPFNNPHNPQVGYFFGKLDHSKSEIPGKATIEYFSMPKHIPLKIPPGGNYRFQTTMNDPVVQRCLVGTWRVVVRNEYEKEKLESNAVEFQTVLTRRGIERLLREVRDTKLPPQDRRWRAAWLFDLQRDLKLQLRYDDVSEEERARMEAATQAELDRFETLWKRDRDTPQMNARLEEINVRYGATADALRAMEERESKAPVEQPPSPKPIETIDRKESDVSSIGPVVPDLIAASAPSGESAGRVDTAPNAAGGRWGAALAFAALLAVAAWWRIRRTPAA